MANRSEASNVLRSYLPESMLIGDADYNALYFKYEARQDGISERLKALVLPESRFVSGLEPTDDHGHYRNFGGVSLEVGGVCKVGGYDSQTGDVIPYRSRQVSMLHVNNVEGPQHARQQLGAIASHIALSSCIRKNRYVVGASYREMIGLGVALGMRPLTLEVMDGSYRARVEAEYKVSFAGYRQTRIFEPSAVYLPTEEFIDRYYQEPASRQNCAKTAGPSFEV